MSNKFFLTRKGLAALRQQNAALLEDLEASTRAMGHSASIDNDLRENPEFMQLRTKVTYQIPNKLAEIEKILSSFQLIEETTAFRSGNFTEVQPGAEVEVESLEDGKRRVFSILGYGDGEPLKGVVSYLSPVGLALLHREVGDEVDLPYEGDLVTYEVIRIQKIEFLD